MIAVLVALALTAAVDDEAVKSGKLSGDMVDLNQATAVQLCSLPGIGPKKAEAILAMRSKRAFTRLTQLLQVKGIGPKTLDRLKARVRVGPPPPPPLPLPGLVPLPVPEAH